MLVVIDQHRAGHFSAGEDVVRRQDRLSQVDIGGHLDGGTDPVAAPEAAGRQHDMIDAEVNDVRGAHAAAPEDLDVRQLAEHVRRDNRAPAPRPKDPARQTPG